ncbi:HWE histidine kinase domain-containing protein [Roseococcus sp. SYP-B2431]|uniref:HWE histidine kinase domain-containing protein n=1 Tax=Roseococcus sp. SYP-B2431 TaxID=2496640 RepID=UPI0013F4181F|nr:HWE histidine kinase domain-containing protein [Roseococcus sp. SYP-B2431]
MPEPSLPVEGIPQLVWRADAAGAWIWTSPQWSDYTGLSPQESRGDGWLAALHPDDRAGQVEEWRRAEPQGGLYSSHRLFDAEAMCYRRFQTHATPMRDADGRIFEWLGSSVEVENLQAEAGRESPLLELRHRMRNTLSVIRSIARRTARTSRTLKSYSMHLEGRLDAVARIQSALMRDATSGLDLAELIADELLAHAAREGNRLRIRGPAVRIRPRAAELVGLAVHELATNAVKFGALSRPDAHLAIDWKVTGEADALDITWKESGMRIKTPPPKRGFGLEVLQDTMAYELKAETQIAFDPDGLRCAMVLPRENIWLMA